MVNEHMTEGMFPKVNARVEVRGEYRPCIRFLHDNPISLGLNHYISEDNGWISGQFMDTDRENIIHWK
jgi:hypothetical protein